MGVRHAGLAASPGSLYFMGSYRELTGRARRHEQINDRNMTPEAGNISLLICLLTDLSRASVNAVHRVANADAAVNGRTAYS